MSAWLRACVLSAAAAMSVASCTPLRIRTPLPSPRAPLVSTDDSQLRRHPPRPFATRSHPLPEIQQFTLENGFTVYLVEQPSGEMIATRLICRRCGDDDAVAPPGLAALTWRTLARTARAGHRRVGGLSIAGGAWQNSGGLAIDAPADRLGDALRLLASAVGVAQIPDEVFASERRDLLVDEQSEGRAGIDLLAAAIFGSSHPYGRRFSQLRPSLQRATTEWVESYRRLHLNASETALIVAGPITRAVLEPVARMMFGRWPAVQSEPHRPTAPQSIVGRAIVADAGHVGLASIMVALPGVSRTSPEYPAMQLLEQIVGGLFGSRLNLTLREQLGLVYSSQAGSVSFRDAGMVIFATQVETSDAVVTLHELMHALRNVRDAGVSRDELNQARRTWHTDMHARMEDLDGIVAAVRALFENGLPTNEYDLLGDAIDHVTTDDVNHTASTLIQPEHATVLVVGDRSAIGSGVQRDFGYVEFATIRD